MQSYTRALIGSSLLVGATALGACGNSSLGDQPVLAGQFDAWTRGGGFTLQASVVAVGSSAPVLASAPIDAAGNFSITLPGAAALAPYLMQQHADPAQLTTSCMGNNLQVSPQDFATLLLTLSAVSGTTKLAVSQATPAPPTVGVNYIYVDRAVNESGGLTCTFGTSTLQESIDLHLGTGWNQEILATSSGTINATTGGVPAGVKWLAK